MIKHILRLSLIFAIIILAFGIAEGLRTYGETERIDLLFLCGIGLILWMACVVMVVKYLNEKEKDDDIH